jgi:hypothetical protein
VTLHRLQRFTHIPGTTYTVRVNGTLLAPIKADEWGLVTVPKVKDAALIELTADGVGIKKTIRKSIKSHGFRTIRESRNFAFQGLPPGSRIGIQNLAGALVKDLGKSEANGEAKWDGTFSTSKAKADGIYFLKVETPTGPAFARLMLTPQ